MLQLLELQYDSFVECKWLQSHSAILYLLLVFLFTFIRKGSSQYQKDSARRCLARMKCKAFNVTEITRFVAISGLYLQIEWPVYIINTIR